MTVTYANFQQIVNALQFYINGGEGTAVAQSALPIAMEFLENQTSALEIIRIITEEKEHLKKYNLKLSESKEDIKNEMENCIMIQGREIERLKKICRKNKVNYKRKVAVK